MKPRHRPWKWLVVLLLGLLVLPLISLALGILWVTPVRVERMPLSEDSASLGRPADALSDPRPTDTLRPTRFALDPQNRIHLFIVMPLFAALTLLLLGGLGVGVWWVWLRPSRRQVDPYGDEAGHDEPITLRLGLFVLILWVALSLLFIVDLLGSASLYPLFVAVYAGFWILVGAVLLYDRPLREKGLILALFLMVVLSLRFVNWNSRKPFLRDLYRIDEGMTYLQVERIMNGYERSFATDTPVDERGQPVTGRVVYTHTNAAWGDSDVGLLMFKNGHVTKIDFLPD